MSIPSDAATYGSAHAGLGVATDDQNASVSQQGHTALRQRWDGGRWPWSVSARPRRRLEGLDALVTEEVVPGEDVVHLKAFGARVPLADVALEERVVANHAGSPSVAQEALRLGATARLAGRVMIHLESIGSDGDTTLPDGEGFTNYSTRVDPGPGSEAIVRRYNECLA
jgi:hypothetical protein